MVLHMVVARRGGYAVVTHLLGTLRLQFGGASHLGQLREPAMQLRRLPNMVGDKICVEGMTWRQFTRLRVALVTRGVAGYACLLDEL